MTGLPEPNPTLSIIVAFDHCWGIGRDNDLPWRLPADLARFKRLTMGSPIIMGRRTHESIGRPLPGRTNIVVTTRPELACDGCLMADGLPMALDLAADATEAFVIGGARLFGEALPMAQRLYLTVVHGVVEADVHFPRFLLDGWEITARDDRPADDRHALAFSFVDLERRERVTGSVSHDPHIPEPLRAFPAT